MAAVNGYQGNTPAASKQSAPPTKTVDSQSVLKRLQSELMGLMVSYHLVPRLWFKRRLQSELMGLMGIKCGSSVLTMIAHRCQLQPLIVWEDIILQLQRLSTDRDSRRLTLLAFQATVYWIWTERNTRLHQQLFKTPLTVFSTIDKQIRNRLQSFRHANPRASSAMTQLCSDDMCFLYDWARPITNLNLWMGGDPGISAFPEEDNIFCWKGTITGSKDTVFEGTEYRLSLSFSNDYPFKPPKIKFHTGCFHPNVDVYGNICLDILQDKWSSAYDVRTILLSIQSLLGEPNISSPLNTQAAQLWSNQEEYRKMVEKLYKPPSA
ncbi:hypothetical protein IGI04_019109 [Brassica rapa subsp. trilocularis]|uniref:UBC core domain-containing protein n=1 Tax=Brassica rapa subsp. trilocularis TaxID=1813537 RepID=A0ABQ7MFU4_BRACM|nr:hypothetical protein IGI04_019109 [Brassica rapa subsp. trilocularis]